MNIQMVDLHTQYLGMKNEIDQAIHDCINSSRFIGGSEVTLFRKELSDHLECKHLITCGNGTDALQIALMALDLQIGEEVIVPAFTYAATAEVCALLGLIPVMVDVDRDTFNINLEDADRLVTQKTKAIIPVHLYGQAADMDAVLHFAARHNLKVIEDNAQSINAEYKVGQNCQKTGTIGDIGTYSFFPSKNLSCYGDGGALSTNNDALAERISLIANHGQTKKYYHSIVGVNSRLDSIQAAVLRVKLRYLNQFTEARQKAAHYYTEKLSHIPELELPMIGDNRSHVFHQYTLKVKKNLRDGLKSHLESNGIPSTVYYPLPVYRQSAYKRFWNGKVLKNTELLCQEVLSLPMHTELNSDQLNWIAKSVSQFFNRKL